MKERKMYTWQKIYKYNIMTLAILKISYFNTFFQIYYIWKKVSNYDLEDCNVTILYLFFDFLNILYFVFIYFEEGKLLLHGERIKMSIKINE